MMGWDQHGMVGWDQYGMVGWDQHGMMGWGPVYPPLLVTCAHTLSFVIGGGGGAGGLVGGWGSMSMDATPF